MIELDRDVLPRVAPPPRETPALDDITGAIVDTAIGITANLVPDCWSPFTRLSLHGRWSDVDSIASDKRLFASITME